MSQSEPHRHGRDIYRQLQRAYSLAYPKLLRRRNKRRTSSHTNEVGGSEADGLNRDDLFIKLLDTSLLHGYLKHLFCERLGIISSPFTHQEYAQAQNLILLTQFTTAIKAFSGNGIFLKKAVPLKNGQCLEKGSTSIDQFQTNSM